MSFVPTPRAHTLQAEAEIEDSDGVSICFLLFGSADRTELDELEIQRADRGPVTRLQDSHALRAKTR